MRPDTVWAEVEYCIEHDYCDEAKQNGYWNDTFYPVRADLNHIPVNGFYRYKTNPTMTGEWVIAGEMKVLRVLSDVEVEGICDKIGSNYLPREHELDLEEFGFAV